MTAQFDEREDRHEWSFEGQRVAELLVEPNAFRLATWSLDSSLEIRCGVPCTFRAADGTPHLLDPREAEQLAPLLGLVRKLLMRVTLTREGLLEAAFANGATLTVTPHPDYGAWELQGGGALEGLTYACPPGGGRPWPSA